MHKEFAKLAYFLAFAITSIFPSLLPAQDEPARYENAPITAAAVDRNGTISAIVYGSGVVVGEPGAVFASLGTNEAPSKIVTVLSGRVNSIGTVGWHTYLDDFYARVYSANTNTGYLSNGPYVEFPLGRPVDSNNVEVTTVPGGTDGLSILPNLPVFAVVSSSNTNDLERNGYWMGFNLTTDSNAVNATTTLIPEAALNLMRSPDGYVMTFHVKSDLAAAGGVRVTIQESGYGQGQLRQGVFSSASQARGYVGDPNVASYAIGLEIDGCADDSNKLSEGICGCGVADADTDGDGALDCEEECINDDLKTEAGVCGCGVADTDSDSDGTADCLDACVSDPAKTEAGICGCGVADVDTDGDNFADCLDGCSADPLKNTPGICGCGVTDVDRDGDGSADCIDQCATDPNKTAPGACGCGVADTDSNNNGIADCNDVTESKTCANLKTLYKTLRRFLPAWALRWLYNLILANGCTL